MNMQEAGAGGVWLIEFYVVLKQCTQVRSK